VPNIASSGRRSRGMIFMIRKLQHLFFGQTLSFAAPPLMLVLDFEIEKEFVEIIKYREAFNDNAAR